jgi:hypothetical protein
LFLLVLLPLLLELLEFSLAFPLLFLGFLLLPLLDFFQFFLA